ncbi:hypothetical protein [Rhodococcus chondri]|uniref:AraC family transcriptional regulator n=1 Tax=Rhodococcus chondri TaxID=3065941 RepID=A0ABU7JQX8_9NOCA|nr:hypothetical protein [Rhodococcus sp. CC-R104]MEE2032435.1 hypothetical protein [Rhodococcus sp. CC-R104]
MNTRTAAAAVDLPLRDTRYRELEQYPEFEFVTAWLRDYVQSTVPSARMREREYWSVSCLPSADATEHGHRMVSVHAGDLEVACLFIETPRSGNRRVGGYVTVSVQALEQACGASIEQVAAGLPALRFRPRDGLMSIGWTETPDSREQFDALPWRPAARELVTGLMNTGRNKWADTHCPQLAMFAIE